MSTPTTQRLEGNLSVVEAARQREHLLALLESQPGDLALDLDQIEEVDTSGVQLLLATARSLRERGHQLRLVQVSVPVRQALRTYGLSPQLAPLASADAGEQP